MKESQYNLYFNLDETTHVVYNTLTGATVETDKEGIKAIQETKEEKFDQKTIQDLAENGIWVDNNADESKIIEVLHEHYKYFGDRAYICTYITFNCNLSCEYCYLEYFTGKPSLYMRNEIAQAVARFAKNIVLDNRCNELVTVFTGGEPLLNFSRISTIITVLDEEMRKQRIDYQSIIFSNGTSLTEGMLDELSQYRVFFQVTLAGSKEVHNRKRPYRNGKGTYDDIIRALTMLKDYEVDFALRIDVDNENFNTIEDMLDDIIEKAGTNLYIKFFPIIPGAKTACPWIDSCFKLSEYRKLSTLWRLARQKGFKVLETPLIKLAYCDYHTNRSYILDPNGDVYKCGAVVGNKKLKIGSLNLSGELIGLNYRYHDWMSRNPLRMTKCHGCKFLPACGGGCAGVVHDIYDTYHGSDCREKYLILERVKFYLEGLKKK